MSVSIFHVTGPVTIGPSSSHTAGAVRIGFVSRKLMGESVKKAELLFPSIAEKLPKPLATTQLYLKVTTTPTLASPLPL
mgnify:CR=1 FL=1